MPETVLSWEEIRRAQRARKEELWEEVRIEETRVRTLPKDLRDFLLAAARFPSLSTVNLLLVAARAPDATCLRTYDEYRADGVRVRHGQKALYLLERVDGWTRPDGQPGSYYRAKPVFDVAQTDGQAPGRDILDSRTLCQGAVTAVPCAVVALKGLPEGVNARWEPEEDRIVLREGCQSGELWGDLMAAAFLSDRSDGARTDAERAFFGRCAAQIVAERHGFVWHLPADCTVPKEWRELEGPAFRHRLTELRRGAEDMDRRIQRALGGRTPEPPAPGRAPAV